MMAVLALAMFSPAYADKETSIGGTIFADWYYDMSDSLDQSISPNNLDAYNTFGISRAYLTGKGKLSDKTWGKITLDVNPANAYMRLKYAYIQWKFYTQPQFDLSMKFGLQGTPWIDEMNAVWGRRYLEKTPTDQLEMETSSDFGLGFVSNLGEKGKWGTANLAIFNGTSYSAPGDNNNAKDINLAVFLNPLNSNADFAKTEIGFQYYTGTLNAYDDTSMVQDDYKKTLISAMANFQYRKLAALGVEYDAYTSPQYLDGGGIWADTSDNKATAMAIFGTLWFADLAKGNKMLETTDLFFRYSTFDPDGDDHDLGGGVLNEMKYTEMIIGVECVPVKGFSTSLNYRSTKITDLPTPADDISASYLYLNMGLSF